MKIAIISDSHDNIVNLEKALDFIKGQKINLIIHCGDLCSNSIIDEVFSPKFGGKLYLSGGNADDAEYLKETCQKHKNIEFFDEFGEVEIENKKIAFCHKPVLAHDLAQSGQYDIVFYGHTHKPWEEKLSAVSYQPSAGKNTMKKKLRAESCKLKAVEVVNPGTLAGLFYKATFAIYDTKTNKLELKILEKINNIR